MNISNSTHNVNGEKVVISVAADDKDTITRVEKEFDRAGCRIACKNKVNGDVHISGSFSHDALAYLRREFLDENGFIKEQHRGKIIAVRFL